MRTLALTTFVSALLFFGIGTTEASAHGPRIHCTLFERGDPAGIMTPEACDALAARMHQRRDYRRPPPPQVVYVQPVPVIVGPPPGYRRPPYGRRDGWSVTIGVGGHF